jgi:hypothetical protein
MRALPLLLLLASPAQADALWSLEIEAAFIDRAFAYEWPEDGKTRVGMIAYREGGAVLVRGDDGYADAGAWRIKGDRLCMSAAPILDGAERCVSVTPEGDKYVTSHGLALLPLSDLSFLTQ